MKWTHTYSTQLLTSRLRTSCSSLALRISYVCLSSSVTPAHLQCWSEVCAQPRHPRVPGKKTIISISFNILSTSRYLLAILPCLGRIHSSNSWTIYDVSSPLHLHQHKPPLPYPPSQSFSAVDFQSHGQTSAILWRGGGVQRFSPTMLTLYRESTLSLYHGKI